MDNYCNTLLANLYLTWLELNFMQVLNKKCIKLWRKKYPYNSRYILHRLDDIACPNCDKSIDIANQIDQKYIPLKSNNSNYEQYVFVFLDLDIHTSYN